MWTDLLGCHLNIGAVKFSEQNKFRILLNSFFMLNF